MLYLECRRRVCDIVLWYTVCNDMMYNIIYDAKINGDFVIHRTQLDRCPSNWLDKEGGIQPNSYLSEREENSVIDWNKKCLCLQRNQVTLEIWMCCRPRQDICPVSTIKLTKMERQTEIAYFKLKRLCTTKYASMQWQWRWWGLFIGFRAIDSYHILWLKFGNRCYSEWPNHASNEHQFYEICWMINQIHA